MHVKWDRRINLNTDQAYDLLKNAGVPDDICIQTVKRWLRERKIKYNGKVGLQNTGYILEDTDQAIHLLKDAGVDANIGMEAVQRWLHEGKIHKVGSKDQIKEYLSNETNSQRILNRSSEQDKTICELIAKIKLQDDHIKGLEELHKASVKALIHQREKLHKEIINLENEKNELQKETRKVLKDNIELRKELLNLRKELSKVGKRNFEKKQTVPPSNTLDYRQKLGLSKTAGQKEVLAGFKKLLKITHPDHGGNATVFHYVKTDYDHFKNGMKG
jgi:regulator of replication initiation timing